MVSIRAARVDDLLAMQKCNLMWCERSALRRCLYQILQFSGGEICGCDGTSCPAMQLARKLPIEGRPRQHRLLITQNAGRDLASRQNKSIVFQASSPHSVLILLSAPVEAIPSLACTHPQTSPVHVLSIKWCRSCSKPKRVDVSLRL